MAEFFMLAIVLCFVLVGGTYLMDRFDQVMGEMRLGKTTALKPV